MDQSELKIISRKEALALGLKRYFTGKPCPKGHIAERKIDSRTCCFCDSLAVKKYYKENIIKISKRQKEYCKENSNRLKKHRKEYRKKYREENRDKILERQKKYHKDNRDRVLERQKKYRKNNRDILNAQRAKRRATKLQSTPSWSDAEKIKTVYAEAKRLEEKTRVTIHTDHIVPLKGKNVCGLHVHYNLRNVVASDNLSKSNRLDESLLIDLYPNYWLSK